MVACGGDGEPAEDEARLRVSGSATVEFADGGTETVDGASTLSFGDVVTLDSGSATLELAGGQTYELRAEPTPTTLEVGAPPTLTAGDVLVTEGFPAQVNGFSGEQLPVKMIGGFQVCGYFMGCKEIGHLLKELKKGFKRLKR